MTESNSLFFFEDITRGPLSFQFGGRYDHIGTHKEGCGGLWQLIGFQGLDPAGISSAVRTLLYSSA